MTRRVSRADSAMPRSSSAGGGRVPALRFPEFREAGEWEVKRLGEIGKFTGGGTPDTSISEYWDGDIQWFTPTEIKQRNLSSSKRTITEKGLQNSSAKLLPKGTLLLSTRATVGDIGIADTPCATNQGFQSLLVDSSEVNIFWYYWIIQHKSDLVRCSSGSTFLEIGKAEIKKIRVLRPGKKEQQKIADCLSSLDELIALHTRKLDALKRHKKGLMQQLFPAEGETVPKLRFPEFQAAGEWAEKRLNAVATINPYQKSLPNEFYYIDLESVKQGNLEKISYITKASSPSRAQRLLKQGDILFQTVRPYQRNNLFFNLSNGHYVASTGYAQIRANCDNGYLYHFLHTDVFVKKVLSQCTGTSYPAINSNDLALIEIAIPDIPEQQKIADCLSSLDAAITAQAEKINALKAHKKGLMQQLFPVAEG